MAVFRRSRDTSAGRKRKVTQVFLIIIGNIISFISACFTALSSWVNDKEKVYYYQTWQCALLALAMVFFQSWSGIATLVLCAIRNYLVAKNQFTKKRCAVFLVLLLVLGIAVNNRGWIGMLVVIATFLYTIGTYLFENPLYIKLNIIMDLTAWAIYDVIIMDYVSTLMDGSMVLLTIVAAVRYVLRRERTEISASD